MTYRNSIVSWLTTSRGEHPVICLHGYGESGSHFNFLENSAVEGYRIIALDLPFHGETVWNEGLNCSPADLYNIIQQILQIEFRATAPPCTLFGYSMGGRIGLSLYEFNPPSFQKILLIAPDGLKVNGWYRLATQTTLGNKLFSFTMRRPAWFFTILKGLNKLKMVNASIFKFVNYYIGDKEVRELLYRRWTTFRKFSPKLTHIKKEIRSCSTEIRLLYGRHDRIILPVVGERFCKGIEKHCRLTILDAGHQLLQDKYREVIVNNLLN